jgi:hypothetical protein
MRFFLAFLLAPFPAALIQAVIVAIWPGPGPGVYQHPASMFAAICLLLYVLALVLGVPTFLVLRRRDPVSLRTHAFTGTLMVLIPTALLMGFGLATERIPARLAGTTVLQLTFLGLLSGVTFWLILRPDRRAALGAGRAGKKQLSQTFD